MCSFYEILVNERKNLYLVYLLRVTIDKVNTSYDLYIYRSSSGERRDCALNRKKQPNQNLKTINMFTSYFCEVLL